MENFSNKQLIIVILLLCMISFGSGILVERKILDNANKQINEDISIEKPLIEPLYYQVYITGAVKKPDVYQVKEGSIVRDILEIAGGPLENADLLNCNLAYKVHDGEKIVIPFKNIPNTAGSDTQGISSNIVNQNASDKININYASKNELMELPGIGETKAQAIIDYRTQNGLFKSIEEIVNVPGIGEKTFEKNKGFNNGILMLSFQVLLAVLISNFTSLLLIQEDYIFATILIFLFIPLICLINKKFRIITIIIATFSLISSYNTFYLAKNSSIPQDYFGKRITFYATVEDFSEYSEYPKYIEIKDLIINQTLYKVKARLYVDYNIPPPFSKIEITGKIKEANNGIIQRISSYQLIVYPETLKILSISKFYHLLNNIRNKIIKNVYLSMRSEEALLLLNSTIGINSLSFEEKEPFAKTGTSHIFAISGLHISVMHNLFMIIFRNVSFLGWFASIFGILLFIIFIGFKISALRAFIMYLLIFLGKMVGRGRNTLNFLFTAAILLLLIFPQMLFSLSFILSFLSMLGLIVLPEYLSKQNKYFASLLKSTFSTELMILPISIYFFNVIPIISFVANLIAIPSLFVLFPVGLTQVVLSTINRNISTVFANISNILFGIFKSIIELFSKIPYSSIQVRSSSILCLTLQLISFIIIFILISQKQKYLNVLIGLYFLTIFTFILLPYNITKIGASKEFQYCLINEDKTTVLILDKNNTKQYSEDSIDRFLKRNGIKKIELLIFLCEDNIENTLANLLPVFTEQSITVEKIFVTHSSENLYKLLSYIEIIPEGTIIHLKNSDIKIFKDYTHIYRNNKFIIFPKIVNSPALN